MRQYLLNVLALIKPYRFRFGVGLLAGFLSGALAFTLPLSLKLAVDTVFPEQKSAKVEPGTSGLSANTSTGSAAAGAEQKAEPVKKKKVKLPSTLQKPIDAINNWLGAGGKPSVTKTILVICFIPGAMLLRGILMYLNMYMLSWVGVRAANDLKIRLFSHVINLPMQFFSKTSTGDLMARADACMNVNNTINGSFGVIIREPISIIVLILLLVKLQPMLSLATLVVFPVCLVPVIVYGRKLRASHKNIFQQLAGVNNVMHESFTASRVIKAYNLESMVVAEFRRAAGSVINFFMRSVRASELPGPLIEFIGAIGVGLIFAYFAFVSTDRAPVGDMLTFFMAVFGLYQPVKNLSRLQSQLTLARVHTDPVYALLSLQTTLPEPADPKPLKAQNAPITFENVTFAYGEKKILHNINLKILPGQLVALVGRTGSGKTSLANLLLRFYDPKEGAVLIGETDIRSVRTRELRENIAMVTQQTILFNRTIRANIELGRSGATEEEIIAAAKHAYAHDFIMEKKAGYDFVVGEKGVNLSGGQQQRLAIARAVLKNAPILILDEATSSLDTEAERIVQAALEQLMKGRTTICIAHRLSTIQRADLIVVLDQGRIVEQGDHASLLKRGGVYHKLFSLQFESASA